MTGWLVRAVSRMLATGAARLLPADRRHWAEAIRAEADQLPAGWPRLSWLAGGFWLVAKEGGMTRRIGYWIGAAGIAAAAVWVVWLSWRTTALADPESTTDRVRVLVGAAALVGLPWVARGRGLFGPVADSSVARFVRIGGCAAICSMGLGIVHNDRHGGINGVVGTGQFSWPREAAGLAILIAAIAVPLILKAKQPLIGPEAYYFVIMIGVVAALAIAPIQAFVLGFAAVILAATSRRSPVTVATWTIGLTASLPTAAAACLLPFALGNLYSALLVVALAATATGACAGVVAARRVTDTGNPAALRAERIRQGALAGAIAGATGGLLAAAVSLILGEMMVLGLFVGLAGGIAGAAIAAGRRGQPIAAGLPAP